MSVNRYIKTALALAFATCANAQISPPSFKIIDQKTTSVKDAANLFDAAWSEAIFVTKIDPNKLLNVSVSNVMVEQTVTVTTEVGDVATETFYGKYPLGEGVLSYMIMVPLWGCSSYTYKVKFGPYEQATTYPTTCYE